jgi:hypothetical protein
MKSPSPSSFGGSQRSQPKPQPLQVERYLMTDTDSSGSPDEPVPPDPLFTQYLAQYEQAAKARTDTALATLKATIFPRLKKWGVAKVQAEYSGYGDSGCINHIAYLDAQNQPLNMDLVKAASDPQIESVLYEFLPAGFEINEGGQGDIYLDVAAGTVTLEHQENYTETKSTSEEWQV